jgi:hypothetical protein
VILSMRLRPHPESKPPSYHGSRESRRYRQRQKLLGQALRPVIVTHWLSLGEFWSPIPNAPSATKSPPVNV